MFLRVSKITFFIFLIAVTGVFLVAYRHHFGQGTSRLFNFGTLDFVVSDGPTESYKKGHALFVKREGAYDPGVARAFYNKATQSEMYAQESYYQMGRLDFLRGGFASAIENFDRVTNGDDKELTYRAHYMRGLTYGFLKNFDEAEKEFRYLIDVNRHSSQSWAYYTDLAWVYFQQGKYQAIYDLMTEDRGIVMYPNNPWVLNMHGLALLNLNREEEAVEVFEKALVESAKLTERDWSAAYPGNDPRIAPQGLKEFTSAIEKNRDLARGRIAVHE